MCEIFNSFEEFEQANIQADVVTVATPNSLHIPLAVKALESGSHVVIEKPMGISRLQCESVLFKALDLHKQVFVVKQNRYSPPSKWLKQVVEEKIIGDVYMVQVNCYWNRDHRYYKADGWKGTAKYDGGILFTQFSHFIDIMFWVFGDVRNIKTNFFFLNSKSKTIKHCSFYLFADKFL